MKKILMLLASLMMATGFVAAASPASATQEGQTVTVVWQMASWNGNSASWEKPQTYVTHAANVGLGIEIPAKCGYFQVDVYHYDSEQDQTNVNRLIKGGILIGPDNPYDEPLIKGGFGTAWKFVNLGECTTPDPTPSGSTTSPAPTPSETTTVPATTPPVETPTTEPPAPRPPLAETGSTTPALASAGLLALLLGAGAMSLARPRRH